MENKTDALDKVADESRAALIYWLDDKNLHGVLKGEVVEIIALMGIAMIKIHKQSGAPLEKLSEMLNDVVAQARKRANDGRD